MHTIFGLDSCLTLSLKILLQHTLAGGEAALWLPGIITQVIASPLNEVFPLA
jgi:hypothetical protein